MMGKIKEIQLESGKYLLVEVQEGFLNHEIIYSNTESRIKTSDRVGDKVYSGILPSGNWQIIGKANELTEDQWKGIVPKALGGFFGHITGYKRFEKEPWMDAAPHKTAIESGLSLIDSEGMTAETTLILKQQANN